MKPMMLLKINKADFYVLLLKIKNSNNDKAEDQVMSLIDGDIGMIGCIKIPDRIFLYAQDGFLLLIKPR